MESHGKKQRRRLSAEEKWNIYQECEKPGIKIGEVLRRLFADFNGKRGQMGSLA